MRARILLASTVIAGAVAAGTITSTAGAAGCSDTGYLRASMPASTHTARSVAADKIGSYETAAAEELVAWRTILNAPLPCSNWLRTERANELRQHADYYGAEKAFAAGNFDAGNALNTAGLHQGDLADALFVLHNG